MKIVVKMSLKKMNILSLLIKVLISKKPIKKSPSSLIKITKLQKMQRQRQNWLKTMIQTQMEKMNLQMDHSVLTILTKSTLNKIIITCKHFKQMFIIILERSDLIIDLKKIVKN